MKCGSFKTFHCSRFIIYLLLLLFEHMIRKRIFEIPDTAEKRLANDASLIFDIMEKYIPCHNTAVYMTYYLIKMCTET